MSKKIFISSVVMTGLLAVGAIGIVPVYARGPENMSPIIQSLAEKFNLDEDEVFDVIDEKRAERHAYMLSHFEDRLNNAVDNGRITEEQKQSILDKHEEMEAKMEELRSQGRSFEDMHAQMASYRNELKQWAKEQGFEFPFREGRQHFGERGMHRLGATN